MFGISAVPAHSYFIIIQLIKQLRLQMYNLEYNIDDNACLTLNCTLLGVLLNRRHMIKMAAVKRLGP